MKFQILAASLLGVVATVGCQREGGGPATTAQPAAAVIPAGATKVVFSVPDMS